MTNYRRLISYIYAYEGEAKGKNIGFAKLESRNGQCKLSVNVKKVYVGSSDLGVYLLAPGKEILLGNIFIRSGSGEFRAAVSVDNAGDSGCSMDQCYGLTIHEPGDAWRAYTTIWEDAVPHAAEVELADVTSRRMEDVETKIHRKIEELDRELRAEETAAVNRDDGPVISSSAGAAAMGGNERTGTGKPAGQQDLNGSNVVLTGEAVARGAAAGPGEDILCGAASDVGQEGRPTEPLMAEHREPAGPLEAEEGRSAGPLGAQEGKSAEPLGAQEGKLSEPLEAKAGQFPEPLEAVEGQSAELFGAEDRKSAEPLEVEEGKFREPLIAENRKSGEPLEAVDRKSGEPLEAEERQFAELLAAEDRKSVEPLEVKEGMIADASGAGRGQIAMRSAVQNMKCMGNTRQPEPEPVPGSWIPMQPDDFSESKTAPRPNIITRPGMPHRQFPMSARRGNPPVTSSHRGMPEHGEGVMTAPAASPASGQVRYPASGSVQSPAFGPSHYPAAGPSQPQAAGSSQPLAAGSSQPLAAGPSQPLAAGPSQPLDPESSQPLAAGPSQPPAPGPSQPQLPADRTEERVPVVNNGENNTFAIGDPQELERLEREEQQYYLPRQLWDSFRKRYPKIQAFDSANGCEILTIKPQDIGLLPRENWNFGNNSFLLHGYYNYRYLIFARIGDESKGRTRYILGVPGNYYSNEKYMASMFGFPHFVLAKKQPSQDGRFGYWYTDIRLENQD